MFGDPERRNKTWQIKKGHYVTLAREAKDILYTLGHVFGKWVPRDENSIADKLSKAELIKAGVEFRIQPSGN